MLQTSFYDNPLKQALQKNLIKFHILHFYNFSSSWPRII